MSVTCLGHENGRDRPDGPQWRDKVLLGRLFELNEDLMARLQAGESLSPQLTLEAEKP